MNAPTSLDETIRRAQDILWSALPPGVAQTSAVIELKELLWSTQTREALADATKDEAAHGHDGVDRSTDGMADGAAAVQLVGAAVVDADVADDPEWVRSCLPQWHSPDWFFEYQQSRRQD